MKIIFEYITIVVLTSSLAAYVGDFGAAAESAFGGFSKMLVMPNA